MTDGGHFFRLQQLGLGGFELFIQLLQFLVIGKQLQIGLLYRCSALFYPFFQLLVQYTQGFLLGLQFLVFLYELQRFVAQFSVHFVQRFHQHVRRLGHESSCNTDGFFMTGPGLQRQNFLSHARVRTQNMLHQPVGQVLQQRCHELVGYISTAQ